MRLYIMCGLPGSGKSEFVRNFKGFHPQVTVICRDDIRTDLHGGEYMFVPSMEKFGTRKVR